MVGSLSDWLQKNDVVRLMIGTRGGYGNPFDLPVEKMVTSQSKKPKKPPICMLNLLFLPTLRRRRRALLVSFFSSTYHSSFQSEHIRLFRVTRTIIIIWRYHHENRTA